MSTRRDCAGNPLCGNQAKRRECQSGLVECLDEMFDLWNFYRLLGEALWEIKEGSKERADDFLLSFFNNTPAFGTLFAAAILKQQYGDQVQDFLDLMHDSYALGLINGGHICMNAAQTISYVQKSDLNAEDTRALFKSCKVLEEEVVDRVDDFTVTVEESVLPVRGELAFIR